MIKKIVLAMILFSLLLAPSQVYATDGLIKPGSRFYFLQTWGEQVKLFFAKSPERKLNYLLGLTDRRVDEIAENPSPAAISRYENHYQKLSELADQVQDKNLASDKIKETNLTQQQVLAEVYVQASDQARNSILNAQESSSEHVAKMIETVEGSQEAQEYLAKTAQIQQMEKVGQLERLNQAPMESNPSSDPSENVPNELKKSNQLQEGKSLNPLNPGQDTQNGGGGNKIEPAKPAQMNEPAGQN